MQELVILASEELFITTAFVVPNPESAVKNRVFGDLQLKRLYLTANRTMFDTQRLTIVIHPDNLPDRVPL